VLLPANDDTRALIDAARIARLPRGAYVVNASRASLIDESALREAIVDGRLSGAALDVFATEPLPADGPMVDHAERHGDAARRGVPAAGVRRADARRQAAARARLRAARKRRRSRAVISLCK
jgi:lactate dehydrogenase-like 2-hydroxyacid dehydrogenase